MKKSKIHIIALSIFILTLNVSSARTLAGIEWGQFTSRSELIFSGCLIKAEYNKNIGEIEYTYRINKTFKGEPVKTVSFKASTSEHINKTIGNNAIVALKKVNHVWVLSVGERSCWTCISEMAENYHGFPTYEIPTILLYNFPKELGETVKLHRLFQDGYHEVEVFVYPVSKVDKHLSEYLNTEPTPQIVMPDQIDQLVTELSSSNGLLMNEAYPILGLPETASTEEVVSKTFKMTSFDKGRVENYKILQIRKVRIRGSLPDLYTAVLVETTFGKKIVLFRYVGETVGWWSRVYDAKASADVKTSLQSIEQDDKAKGNSP